MQKLAILLVVLAGAAALGIWFLDQCEDDWCLVFAWQKIRAADSFERCASLGFPVMESYPRQCRAGDKLFGEEIRVVEYKDLIRVQVPLPDTVVVSPLRVQGEARGSWYFEASFPVRLTDANGNNVPLDPPYIMTAAEWMTTEFVPFSAELRFAMPATDTGTLVLEKDNPSGLPEHADSVSIPVRFR